MGSRGFFPLLAKFLVARRASEASVKVKLRARWACSMACRRAGRRPRTSKDVRPEEEEVEGAAGDGRPHGPFGIWPSAGQAGAAAGGSSAGPAAACRPAARWVGHGP
eukprot:scaffold128117_cov60-Phaeocystis_antarctica.AAC.1